MRLANLALALAFLLAGWFLFRSTKPDLHDPAAVVIQIRQLNQLSTVRHTIQRVVTLEEPRPPLSSERILLILQARVEAGIDLSTLTPKDIERVSNGTLVIRLPAPQILNAAVDEAETRVWDRQKTWWTPWVPYDKNMEQRARVQGLEEARKAAIAAGILRQAEINAETSIRTLLNLSGTTKVTIIPSSQS